MHGCCEYIGTPDMNGQRRSSKKYIPTRRNKYNITSKSRCDVSS